MDVCTVLIINIFPLGAAVFPFRIHPFSKSPLQPVTLLGVHTPGAASVLRRRQGRNKGKKKLIIKHLVFPERTQPFRLNIDVL